MSFRILDETATEQQCVEFFNNEMHRLLCCCPFTNFQKICVAVSGGADSVCLLWLLHGWCAVNNKKLYCVTVDHKLRQESRQEADFVHDFCESLHVKHEILDWNHEQICDHGKLENLARNARYKLIARYCFKNAIGCVCVAHNWDDQLETYKLRERYKSTMIGLACMSQIRTVSKDLMLLRPVLFFTKKCLQNLLVTHCIDWKNDSMNDDDTYQRVKFRKQLKKANELEKEGLKNDIISFRIKRHDIETIAVDFLKNSVHFSQYGFAEISHNAFSGLNKNVQNEVLRRTLWCVGGNEYLPTFSADFWKNIFTKKTQTLWNCVIKHKKHKIMIFREDRNIPKIQLDTLNKEDNCLMYDNRFKINVDVVRALIENYKHNEVAENYNANFLFAINDVSLLEGLPQEVVQTLPRIVTNDGDFILCSGIEFVKKVNLFDVFV